LKIALKKKIVKRKTLTLPEGKNALKRIRVGKKKMP
jgi:hypothetical protein